MLPEMEGAGPYIVWCAVFVFTMSSVEGDCLGPQMKLVSDDPRRTCTQISASKNFVEYSCAALIKGFPKAMIKYCPIETCLPNGSWSKPSISCALSECYQEGRSGEYVGHRMCTISGRMCQSWSAQEPHKHKFRDSDFYPDQSAVLAESFCRDPNNSKGAPWCFTLDIDKKWEYCGVQKCSSVVETDGFCGKPQLEEDYYDNVKPGFPEVPVFNPTDVDSPKICANNLAFQMNKDYRINGNSLLEASMRSAVECATMCSKMTSCRALTYHRESRECVLHGSKDLSLTKSRGYTSGVKSCSL